MGTHLEKREVSFDRQESTFDKSNDAKLEARAQRRAKLLSARERV